MIRKSGTRTKVAFAVSAMVFFLGKVFKLEVPQVFKKCGTLSLNSKYLVEKSNDAQSHKNYFCASATSS